MLGCRFAVLFQRRYAFLLNPYIKYIFQFTGKFFLQNVLVFIFNWLMKLLVVGFSLSITCVKFALQMKFIYLRPYSGCYFRFFFSSQIWKVIYCFWWKKRWINRQLHSISTTCGTNVIHITELQQFQPINSNPMKNGLSKEKV